MSIQVNDFRWEPGKNDAEYIKLLESSRDEWQRTAQKAIAKLKMLSKAQEPVQPKWEKGYAYCGQCGYKLHWIVDQNNFCPNCGKAVKWG